MIPFWAIWLVVAVVFFIIEAATVDLASIWFALGALAAMWAAFMNFPVFAQVIIFIAVSAVLLVFTRDLAKKYINNKVTKTNSDRLVGMEGLVIIDIDNMTASGQIKVMGEVWSARSITGEVISEGKKVLVHAIEGAKMNVSPLDEEEPRSAADTLVFGDEAK